MADREKVQDASTVITTETQSLEMTIEGCGQVGIEVYPSAVTGGLKVAVEFAYDDDRAWVGETIEDASTGVVNGQDLEVPVLRYVRTFATTANRVIFLPCAGYKWMRLKLSAGTSAQALIMINRQRLAIR